MKVDIFCRKSQIWPYFVQIFRLKVAESGQISLTADIGQTLVEMLASGETRRVVVSSTAAAVM